MAQPVVSFWNANNTAQITSYDVGVVDAGSVTTDTTFLIFNNKGGSTAVSDMTNVTVTTKDSAGGNTGEFIANKWVEVKCPAMGDVTFTPVGGTTTKAIKAKGASVASGVIKGSVNDGTSANAQDNYAEIIVHVNVPALATAGVVNGLFRCSYQHT